MKKCLLLTTLLFVNSWCYADYNEGAAAYQRGDYQNAFRHWKMAAEQKSTLSQDFEWKVGGTQDNTEAQYGLALLYWQGKGTPQNYHEAEKWLLSAADCGHSDAQLKLAYLYLTGLSGKRKSVAARKWFEKSAQQGNIDAQYNLGLLYKNGQGIPRDLTAAKKWLSLAAQQGDSAAKKLLVELGSEPTTEKPLVTTQPTPNKPAEQQLAVAPYPIQNTPTWATEKKPEANKTTASQATAPAVFPAQTVIKNIISPPATPEITQPAPIVQNAAIAQDEQYYAIQLLSSAKQSDTLAFVEQWQAALNPLLATDKLRKAERVFIIVYGHYASPNEAKQAMASLPDELKQNHPWVIKMRGTTFVP